MSILETMRVLSGVMVFVFLSISLISLSQYIFMYGVVCSLTSCVSYSALDDQIKKESSSILGGNASH